MVQNYFNPRTDLAVEEKERFTEGEEISGVLAEQWERGEGLRLTRVEIKNSQGAKAMGKPEGVYVTIEAEALAQDDPSYHKEAAKELGGQLREMIDRCCPGKKYLSVFVAGLGNMQVTPDSLGPRVIENLQMTRHLNLEYSPDFCRMKGLPVLSGMAPGVMGQTGMETAEIVKGAVVETRPDLIIAVDALAARSARRLASTIQLADTGIHPGSGVGNHRKGLTRESLGIPVIAVGIPTVIGAAGIVHDTVKAMIQALLQEKETKAYGSYMERISPEEQYQLIRELLEPEFGPMFVTPQDIDERVRRLSFTVSEGIHQALYREKTTG